MEEILWKLSKVILQAWISDDSQFGRTSVTCPSTSKKPSSPLVEQTIPQNWPLDLPSCFTGQDLPANHSSPLCFRSTWPKNPRGKAPNKIQTLMPGPSFWLAQSNFVYRFKFSNFQTRGYSQVIITPGVRWEDQGSCDWSAPVNEPIIYHQDLHWNWNARLTDHGISQMDLEKNWKGKIGLRKNIGLVIYL